MTSQQLLTEILAKTGKKYYVVQFETIQTVASECQSQFGKVSGTFFFSLDIETRSV